MNEQRIHGLQSKFKWLNICVTGVPKKGGGEENRQKKTCENNAPNLSKLDESYKPTNAKSQRTSSTKA